MITPELSSSAETRGGRRLSQELRGWLGGEGEKTVASLLRVFDQGSFAILFVLLLGVPACPRCRCPPAAPPTSWR